MDTARYVAIISVVVFAGLLAILGGVTGHVAIFAGCLLTPGDMLDSADRPPIQDKGN